MFTPLGLSPSKKKLMDFAGGMALISLFGIPIAIHILDGLETKQWIYITTLGSSASATFVAFRYLCPLALKPLYIAWVGLAAAIGLIIGPLLLTLIYYGVITPVVLISRGTGKIWLETNKKETYWKKLKPHKKNSFYQQF